MNRTGWEPLRHRATPMGVPADHFTKGHSFLDPAIAAIAAVAAATGAVMQGPAPGVPATILRQLAGALTPPGQANVVQRRWGKVVSVNADAPNPPGPPTITAVTGIAAGTAVVAYLPPADNGGAPIDNYQTVVLDATGAAVLTQQDSDGSPTIIAGLSATAPYTFTVQAHNGYGWGQPSIQSKAITLGAAGGPPTPPTNIVPVAGDGQVVVSFTPPQSDGGAPVDDYRVQTDSGVVVTATASPITLTGLTNGVPVSVRARAHNTNGWGDWSGYYGPVTPQAATINTPGQPQGLAPVQVGTDGLQLSFVPPDPGGGTLDQIEVLITEAGIKPVMYGLIDNGGNIPAAYAGQIENVVVTCRWADLQTAQGGALQWTTAQSIASDVNGADQYTGRTVHADIETARAAGYLVKLRPLGGIWAPDWLKALIPGGPIAITDPQSGTNYTVGLWWRAAYRDAYADLLSKIAATYDADPVVAEVAVTRCTTIFGESFTRQGSTNNAALITAGFDAPTDLAAIAESIDQAGNAFLYTRFSLPLNPYQYIHDATHTTVGDSADTISIAQAAIDKWGTRFIPGQHSVRDPMLAANGYSDIYNWLAALSKPFYLQVAQNPSIGNLLNALSDALLLGPVAIELHANEYEVLAQPAGLQPAATALTQPETSTTSTIIDGPFTYAEPLVMAGLTQLLSGHTYSVAIRAHNQAGWGDWSAAARYSTTQGGATPPDAPVTVTATQAADVGGVHSVHVAYTDQAANGAAITDHRLYVIDRTTGVTVFSVLASAIGTGTANPLVLTDSRLVTGHGFAFQVSGINTAGEGTPSAASPRITIQQNSTAPGAPGAPTAAAQGSTAAVVQWTAAADNGAAIDYYVVTASTGQTAQTADGTTLQATVTGLAPGTAVTFTVKAHNVNGLGTASAASNSVTPALAVPGAPTIGVASILSNGGGAIGIRGVPHGGTTGAADNLASIAIGNEPGRQAGDVLRIFAWQRSNTATFTLYKSDGTTVAADWTAIPVVYGPTSTNAWAQQAWERTVDSPDTTDPSGYVVKSNAATQRLVGALLCYEGIDTTTPDDPATPTASGQANNAQASVDAGTPAATTIDGDLMLAAFAVAAAAAATPATITPPAGWTQRGAQINTTDASHNNVGMILADKVQSAHGSPGDIAATVSAGTPINGGIAIVLRAAKGKALVPFSAPATNGGSAIDLYTATSSPGGFTGTVAGPGSGTIEVDGLAPGTAYTFTVTAHNAQGTGAASAASNSVTPTSGAADPDPPTAVTFAQTSATPGAHQFQIGYTNGASNGAAITNHRAFIYDAANPAAPVLTTKFATANPFTLTDQTLQTGHNYYVVLTAINGQGESAGSTPSAAVTVTDNTSAPGAPGAPTATAGNAQAIVQWAAAADNGLAIDYYVVTSSPGGFTAQTADGTTLQATVTGLANGTAYTFTVKAHNADGLGTASAASNSVTPAAPATAPGAPGIGTATVTGAGTVSVPYTAPASNGGATIDKYVATSSPGGITGQVTQAGSGSITVAGLDSTGATSYTFTVKAHNSVGFSAASAASNSVTPTGGGGGVPTAPTITNVGVGNAQLVVAFSVPSAGAPFTGYEAQTDTGAFDVTGSASPITLTGLTNGTAYRVRARAQNAAGWGPWTAWTAQHTPAATGYARSLQLLGALNQPGVGTYTAAQGAIFDIVTQNPGQCSVAALRTANPSIQIYRYNKASHLFSGEYSAGGWPESMFLHSDHPGSPGTRLFTGSNGAGTSNVACVDPNHTSFIALRKGNVDTDIVHGAYDGEFLDVEGPDAITAAQDINGNNSATVFRADGREYDTPAGQTQWEKDMGVAGGVIGAYAVSKSGKVVGNGLVNSGSWAKTKYLYHAAAPTSGTGEQTQCMAEGFLFSGHMKNGFSLPTQTFAKAEIAMIQEATDPAGINGVIHCLAKAWTTMTTAQNTQARRLAAAVVLLGHNGFASSALAYEAGDANDFGPNNQGYPDLQISLGDPAVAANLNDTNGVMSRVYPGGLVLLNMTGAAQTFPLPATWGHYTDQDGNTWAGGATIPSNKLPNNTALILTGSA